MFWICTLTCVYVCVLFSTFVCFILLRFVFYVFLLLVMAPRLLMRTLWDLGVGVESHTPFFIYFCENFSIFV